VNGTGGQLDLFPAAARAECADKLCICTHYGIEHDGLGTCQARDLFENDCGCFGYELDPNPDGGK
jgi:hypothetical protein